VFFILLSLRSCYIACKSIPIALFFGSLLVASLTSDSRIVGKVLSSLDRTPLSLVSVVTDWVKSVVITLPKVTGATECADHHTIALIGHASKILLRILLQRTEKVVEEQFAEEQIGFRKRVGM